jgi:tetratricopeptide (TPR) repeat protein
MEEIASQRRMGRAYNALGDRDTGLACYGACLQLAQQIGNEEEVRQSALTLGEAYRRTASEAAIAGAREDAIKNYRHYAEMVRLANDKTRMADAEYKLGEQLRDAGNYVSAASHFLKYREIAGELADEAAMISAAAALAETYALHGDIDQAAAYRDEQIKLSAGGRDSKAECEAAAALGAIATQRGDFDGAAVHFERMYTMAQDVGSSSLLDKVGRSDAPVTPLH